ncbi:hypothetical protein ACF8PD_14665 [Vibrio plantisponsor]|uniref:hypothetical protein n=1 Tax=Vibrio plantisponsor TaxID=664643 RepID=UPI00370C2BDC
MEDKTVLEQANAALAEAREVLRKADESLEKSQSNNEVLMAQNRRLGFALSSLLPKQYFVGIDLARSEQEPVLMSDGQVLGVLESFEHREVYDVIHAINVLAMANTDVLHVFADFSGHINQFSVHAHPANAAYKREVRDPLLINERVSLGRDNPLEKLLSIESQLTELIIEAREQAEANAEVTHG